MYSKSTQEINQTVAGLTKSADCDDAATHLSKIGSARQEVQRQYDQSTRAVANEVGRLSASGTGVDKTKLEAFHQKDRVEFGKFKDHALKSFNEKEANARERLRRKEEKKPERWI
ncbi:hypothetical protein PFICI_06642 [Pestalotiopsis fici W106-1]|uniref:Uncharacterized protein n=1 Tax=Pestalotiopsis fici (strain W106-1 / CGMCC3.15140) TaxID=1229662 RepID=W3X6G8_PESFW|nr:uncharacterized protein PFICI_06642 [Pestalotiopsis fici W106-1]ETS81640.1 hypothetical protein PFICI_06642 [Pestalotiopsis fici W106-1]